MTEAQQAKHLLSDERCGNCIYSRFPSRGVICIIDSDSETSNIIVTRNDTCNRWEKDGSY